MSARVAPFAWPPIAGVTLDYPRNSIEQFVTAAVAPIAKHFVIHLGFRWKDHAEWKEYSMHASLNPLEKRSFSFAKFM